MKKIKELSIFFPFWNEEKNIEKVVLSAIPIASEHAEKWEILMVDDGSSDGTLKEAQRLEKKHKNLRVITHNPNRGYGSALREGVTHSRYNTIVFADGDAQFEFSEVSKFIERINTVDIVIGYRKKRQDDFSRHVLMYMLKIWDYVFFRFHFKDIDCGFKMFRREALEQIGPLRSEGAMITTEILAKATRKKLKIAQVEVSHFPRKYGEQSGAHLGVVIRAVLESFILWWDIKNSRF